MTSCHVLCEGVYVSTKNDLLAAWCRWTGDQLPEARHRIRALSEDDLLPNRSDPITYADFARALLGFLVSDTHKDAPRKVRHACSFVCSASSPEGDKTIATSNLLDAMVIALQPPFTIVSLEVCTTGDNVTLYVLRDSNPLTNSLYSFTSVVSPETDGSVFPATIRKSVHRELIQRLLDSLTGNASTTAEPKTTTAAEAPPSRGRQPKATQTAHKQPKPLIKAKATRTLTSASKPSVRSDPPAAFNRTLDL